MVVQQESKENAIKRLEVYVRRLERRYEIPSDSMCEAVSAGQMRETAEISKWMTNYRVLLKLKGNYPLTTSNKYGIVELPKDER